MNEPTNYKEVINSNEVGSMEEAFGKDDSMFLSEVKPGGTMKQNPVDLTGSQIDENTTPEDFGNEEAIKGGAQNGENPVTETPKDEQSFIDPAVGTQDDGANDHRLSTVKPEKEYPVDTVIEYLYNPENKKVFPANKDIVKQKHLIPCTKEGKLLPDERTAQDFI
jgi:hypothetical protein